MFNALFIINSYNIRDIFINIKKISRVKSRSTEKHEVIGQIAICFFSCGVWLFFFQITCFNFDFYQNHMALQPQTSSFSFKQDFIFFAGSPKFHLSHEESISVYFSRNLDVKKAISVWSRQITGSGLFGFKSRNDDTFLFSVSL